MTSHLSSGTRVTIGLLFMLLTTVGFAQQNGNRDLFIDSLMNKMTLLEKLGQLNLVTPGGGILTGTVVSSNVEQKISEGKVGALFGAYGPERLRGIQELAVNESRLGIPILFGADIIHGYKTTFPIPLGLSCSWDMELIDESASVAAKEATADGVFWNFSPMVDISRDPRWGRVAEGGGEDPFLGSAIAKAMISGYQGNDLADLQTMMATVKHLALYGAVEAGRDYNTTDMSRLKMYNSYLPPYKAAIEAGVGSAMTSFNDIDGIPATGNRWLLTNLLREEWGFEGFVVSDYTSVTEMTNHGLGDLQAVSALALNAGLDMDMVSEGLLGTLGKSLEEGKVSMDNIDQACRRILEAKYKLGLFDDPFRYFDSEKPARDILTAENRAVARTAARSSFVLLKNEKRTLPLSSNQKIALIGPLAHSRENMLGTWAPTGDIKNAVTIREGFINRGNIDFTYEKGSNILNDKAMAKKINVFGERVSIDQRTPQQMIDEAVEVAKEADVVVAVVGEATEMSGESASRTTLNVPEPQKQLLRALKTTGKPLVLVLMAGRPLTINDELEWADALLYTWHPGVEAGNAVADVLFGDYNPAGKLTMTFPRKVGQIPIYYAARKTGRPQAGKDFEKFKSNYLDVDNTPLLPFGYGLSYTNFTYDNLRLSQETLKNNGELTVTVTLKNSGAFEGEEVAQLYIRDKVASITRPMRLLRGFQKVALKSGEAREVTFKITEEELKFYNYDLRFVSEPGEFEVFVGGNSNATLSGTFRLID